MKTRTSTPAKQEFQDDVIVLRHREIPVRTGYMSQARLKFYSENPRIYSMVWTEDKEEPTQEQIFNALSRQEHIRETLLPSIRHNGGLIEPVLVKGDIVLEGNCRLAAYRLLSQAEPGKWDQIRVRSLPESITESEIFSLLGEYHIVGKKDWQPYEQAGYLYRRFKNHGVAEDALKEEVGLPITKIRHLIRVYGFMLERNDRKPEHWSYFDELLKGRRFDAARELYPHFDTFIADKVESGEIERAVDLRDQLPLITKMAGKTLKKFMDDRLDFDEAVADAKMRGAGNYNLRKLSDFRLWLAEEHIDGELCDTSEPEKHKLLFELQKIETRVKGLLRKLSPSSRSR